MSDEAQHPDNKLVRELDLLSVSDLEERIRELQQEIKLCEVAIARKDHAKSVADSIFSFGNKG